MPLTIVRLPSATQLASYLTQSSASTTYLTKTSASTTYLTQSSASSTYLTRTSASTTYSTIVSPTFSGTVNAAAVNMNGVLSLNNYNITGVGNLEFNDGGVGEGLSWLGGNGWKVYESPNSLINSASGNFQIVQDSTRRLTIDSSSGILSTHRSLFIGDDRTSTESLYLEIGAGRSASGYAYIDLIGDTTYTDYGLRIIRNNTGANTDSVISHRGTGIMAISAQDAGSVRLSTNGTSRVEVKSTGDVGIGTTSPLANLHIIDSAAAVSDIRLGNNVNGTVMNLFSSTADLQINNVTATGSLSLGTNNTSRFLINSAGKITMPEIPAVYAFNTTNTTVADNGVIIYNSAYLNNGNHYNATTSTFTAPVAGRYFVIAKVLTFNDSGASDLRIAVNGTRVDAYAGYSLVAGVVSTYKQGHVHGVVSLAANDTIQIRSVGSVSFYGATAGHTSLSIHLIG